MQSTISRADRKSTLIPYLPCYLNRKISFIFYGTVNNNLRVIKNTALNPYSLHIFQFIQVNENSVCARTSEKYQ